MENSVKQMVGEIVSICKVCGQVPLGPACGKYAGLLYEDDGTVSVRIYSRRGADDFKELSTLPKDAVKKIYDDVMIDFS